MSRLQMIALSAVLLVLAGCSRPEPTIRTVPNASVDKQGYEEVRMEIVSTQTLRGSSEMIYVLRDKKTGKEYLIHTDLYRYSTICPMGANGGMER